MREAVYRHYYGKLKKLLKLSEKNHRVLLPHDEAYQEAGLKGMLYRGQSPAQTDELLKSGSTKSNQSMNLKRGEFPDSTYAAAQMRYANLYGTKGKDGRPVGDVVAFIPSEGAVDSGPFGAVAFPGPVKKEQVRSILVKDPRKQRLRPLSLGEARERGFAAELRLRELSRGEYLRRVIGYFEPVPARRAAEAARGAGKLRYYRSNPAGKEIARVRQEILADPYLGPSSRFKSTPGLTVVNEYDEAHHFPKKSRDTKLVIDNLNKHAARGKPWAVSKGALGQPIVRAEGIERLLCAKLRLRELASIL